MATYNGTTGNDSYNGTPSDDTVIGNYGSDTLNAGDGNDVIYGEAKINPQAVKGTETGTTTSLTYVNNTGDTVFVYRVLTDGTVTRLYGLQPGQSVTESVPLQGARIIGNQDGTEFYSVAKQPGTAVTNYTMNATNDELNGGGGLTGGDDTIYGQLGDDTIYGNFGNDYLDGGTGADLIRGGAGDDIVIGGDGDDTLFGLGENDLISGGNGNDIIDGGTGADTIRGGSGDDSIVGGSENDQIYGDGGADTISGDGGADTLFGSLGDDSISGGDGADSIFGEAHDDQLLGGQGDDTISGGVGDDYIDGGTENDRLSGDSGNDTIFGGAGAGNDVIEGGIGDDSLVGGDGNDIIYGNAETPPTEEDMVITPGTGFTNDVHFDNLNGNQGTPNEWQSVVVDGQTYVITLARASDGYFNIYRLENDGTLTETDWMRYENGTSAGGFNAGSAFIETGSDGKIAGTGSTAAWTTINGSQAQAFGNALTSVQIVEVDGQQMLFTNSQNGAGVTAWTFNSDGTIDYAGSIHFGGSQAGTDGGIGADTEFYTDSSGTLHLYVTRTQNDHVTHLTYNPANDTFTESSTKIPVGDSPAGQTMFSVDGNDYLAIACRDVVQVYQVDPATGGLTLVDDAPTDAAPNAFGDVDVYTMPDGRVFLTYSSNAANQVNLYQVGSDGSMTPTDVLLGQGDFFNSNSTTSYINGQPIIVIPDSGAGVTRLYSINEDGGFSLEAEVATPDLNSSAVEIPPMIVQSADGSYYLVDGRSGLTYPLQITTAPTDDDDYIDGGDGDDQLYGQGGNDTLVGGVGDDTLDGGDGDDTLSGGTGADRYTGGEGFDTFVAGTGDIITDFNTGTGQDFNDDDQTNNDFVDLSGYYNDANLALYNAANGTDYDNPLQWMRADQADDGVLNMMDGTGGLPNFTMTIQNGGAPVDATALTYDNTNVLCFGSDAMIATADGQIAAGDLEIGDLVATIDDGIQPIRWIGKRRLDTAMLAANPKLRPIRIRAGALGAGLPEADLIVSPQHRMLVRSKIAQKMFGTNEVLVAAKQLTGIAGVEVASDLAEVVYVHFLFDAHQIVLANGAETESLYTGEEALKSVGEAARAEIFTIFPELRDRGDPPLAARELTSGRLGRKLAMRHAQNRKALV